MTTADDLGLYATVRLALRDRQEREQMARLLLRSKVLEWYDRRSRSVSAIAMASAACGLGGRFFRGLDYPRDGGDFGRCVQLLREIPEIRQAFPAIAAMSWQWRKLIEHWHELETAYRAEEGITHLPAVCSLIRRLVG